MPWSPKDIAVATQLAGEGCSSTEIAAVLMKTRNAVIGKLSRMGVELKGLAPRVFSPKISRPRAERRNPMILRQKIVRRPGLVETINMLDEGTKFLDLKPHHCRWPFGEDGRAYVYCGRQRYPNSSYCLDHEWISRKRD